MSDVLVIFKVGLVIQGQTVEMWLEEKDVEALFATHKRVKNSMGGRYEEKTPFIAEDKYGRKLSIDMQQVSLIMVLE